LTAGKHEDEGNDNEWKWLSPSNNKYSGFGLGWVKYEESAKEHPNSRAGTDFILCPLSWWY
jgi:hypothetical protein